MAAQIENSPFFLERKSAGKIVVKGNDLHESVNRAADVVLDPPKFDLESYIANYDGMFHLSTSDCVHCANSMLQVPRGYFDFITSAPAHPSLR
jgi:hypothetical protein